MMRIDTYGDIVHPDMKWGLQESLKETAARQLAEEIAINLNESYDDPVAYVEAWYYYDYDQRCWRPK